MEEQRFTPDIIARAEALISRIRGICSSRITTDETGRITEVHVVATADKPQKLIARDVETCLKAELGVHVDYKKISVVMFNQVQEKDEPAHLRVKEEKQKERAGGEEQVAEFPVEEFPARFIFQSVNIFVSNEGIRAEVELSLEGAEAFGSSSCDNSAASHGELVAEATLKAVSEFLDAKSRLCLSKILEVETDSGKVMLVIIHLLRNRESKTLAGCSIITGDLNQAVVYATLDAVNRVLGKLKSKSPIEYKIE